MIVQDLLNVLCCPDDILYFLKDDRDWIGSFPVKYVPEEYKNLSVAGVSPDQMMEDGDIYLRVWVDEGEHA